MANERPHGGEWSELKLQALQKYLQAYTTALSKQKFTKLYIDAFAGGGTEDISPTECDGQHTTSDSHSSANEIRRYRQGSPIIARDTRPHFEQFAFIDKSARNLERLKLQFDNDPRTKSFINEDANIALKRICAQTDWISTRAVAFLDPFAMQVEWSTIQAIADTKAIDMWLLFPAMAVNRMLTKSGDFYPGWERKLTGTFGSAEWKTTLYEPEPDLFDETRITKKSQPFQLLRGLVISRLKSEFPNVVDEPLILKTASNTTLFFLCFAAANEGRGGAIACNIAQHIIQHS